MAKLNDIRALAESHAAEIARSVQAWTGYLDTAATLYRYDFPETLLIHAQRPDATACAEMEIWNNRMGRWVNRGSKGIALIDDSGPRKSLRYVFDISDTHMVRGGKTPYIWQMESWVRPEMSDYLADTYGLETDPEAPLPTVLMSLARAQTEENLNDAMDGLSYEIQGTWLEELGQDAVREGFRRLMENSTYYMLARRCGLDPWEELTPDDFTGITNFNRLSVLSFLGNAAHDIAEPVLRDIGRELILRYRLRAAEQKIDEYIRKAGFEVENGEAGAYNGFSTLIRESINEEQTSQAGIEENEGGTTNGSDLHEEGRLPVSEPGDQRIQYGKYGMLRKTFLKENRKNWYQSMMLTGKLERHLQEIDETANDQMERISSQMAQAEGVDESLKAADPMAWVQQMNNIRIRAEETVLRELVYS